MAIHPMDTEIYRADYAAPEMRAIFDERSIIETWLFVEGILAEVQGELGIIPLEVAKEIKAKASKIVVKEIRFGPNTDDHDYNFKLKHAMRFLEEGAKVRAYVFFKGRSILFKEQGEVLLLRFANDLEDYGKVEQLPRLEGKRMIISFSPKKKM